MSVGIREMTMADYDAMLALWQISEGIGLSNADSRDNIASYLQRNPGLSFSLMIARLPPVGASH